MDPRGCLKLLSGLEPAQSFGKVTKVEDNEATVEIADNVRVRIVKSTLADVRSKSEPVPANTNTPS